MTNTFLRIQTLIFQTRCASLFFGDIVGFTNLTAMSTARQTIEFLNDLYNTFDSAIERYDVYKVLLLVSNITILIILV